MRFFSVYLKWVGTDIKPWFWGVNYALHYGIDVTKAEPFGASAIEAVRRTWHVHEAEVVDVIETTCCGKPMP